MKENVSGFFLTQCS